MASFCSENGEVISDANYMDSYNTRGKTSCLPNGGIGFSDGSISDTGIVDRSELDSHISTLLSKLNAAAPSGINPSDTNPAEEFSGAAATLRMNIKTEYCFYYKRYMYALNDILMTAATSSPSTQNLDYSVKKQNTEMLNSKLNQLLQILQGLVNSRLNTLKMYYGAESGVNQVNQELETNRDKLIKHSNILKNSAMETDVRSAMIDYTLEKNSSSRNLLAIYGFMNIVAAGLIFYLYRSTN
jgi:hypothetical protein